MALLHEVEDNHNHKDNVPINVKSHYPPPGLTRGIGGDLTFQKIKFSTHRRTADGQISVYYAQNAL